MKITSIELHPANSSAVFTFSFRDPARQNPYNIKNIVGLDAEAIIPRYYGTALNSDSPFYSQLLQKRDLVIRIELNPRFNLGETYPSLRDDLYKIISSSRTGLVEIWFKNGSVVVATISGLITKFEGSHFARVPEVQLTFQTVEPLLKAPTATNVTVAGLDPADTLISDTVSTSPHGFAFEIALLNNLATISIGDPNDASWTFDVTPSGGFLANDVVHFSSDFNNKFLYIVRGATPIYIADAIVPGSIWPLIFPGDNTFGFDSPTLIQWNAISYYRSYWGI